MICDHTIKRICEGFHKLVSVCDGARGCGVPVSSLEFEVRFRKKLAQNRGIFFAKDHRHGMKTDNRPTDQQLIDELFNSGMRNTNNRSQTQYIV